MRVNILLFIMLISMGTLSASKSLIQKDMPEIKSFDLGENCKSKPEYATWIMVWIGSTEKWFNPDSYIGATMWVNNTWKATNWNDNAQVDEFILNMKNAGIKIIICDLTNGFRWMNKVKYIQSVCAQYGMQVCVSNNYKGNFETFDSNAKLIYDNLAGPGAPNKEAYFNKDGKPLIVSYCTKTHYDAIESYSSEMKSLFNFVWSSGEDSKSDKWGWQLEPEDGTVPSKDAMFVTSSIKWAPSKKPGLWRKSLAWLDYNFLIARENNPKYIIVGSYDDIHERNGWLIANTTNCERGMQMRDKFGAISTDAYNKRVKEWTSGGKVSTIPGGLINDGCYIVKNQKSNLALQMRGGNGYAESILEQSSSAVYPMNQYFWFYHLGNNIYRIIPLTSGLPLTPVGASTAENTVIEQNWDQDVPNQKWKLEQRKTGEYYLMNVLSNKYLDVKDASVLSGTEIIQTTKSDNENQVWTMEAIVQL
ncbi:MAG: RICIN domain-containing protein [Paludibacter sp.]|nr:RICIN domain-containing protein [Paludibacter sp.]